MDWSNGLVSNTGKEWKRAMTTSIDIFAAIREQLTLAAVCADYGILIDRGGRCRCPFHDDHHPSAKLYPERLHCFVCNKSWDAVGIVCDLFGLKPIDAARKISDDYGLGLFSDRPPTFEERKQALAAKERRERSKDKVGEFDAWLRWARDVIAEALQLWDDLKWEDRKSVV